MTRFRGPVGYGETQETFPHSGVDELVVTERTLSGDLIRNTKQSVDGAFLNNDLTVSNSVSVVADPYATENFFAIRYVKIGRVRWEVVEVDASTPPRLVLRLGKVYNGPIPA
jgi:hypothetical protein